MDLTRQEYPALLTSLQPSEAVVVLNDRIKLITKINSDIADWLQERRRVEEIYVQGLRKLARRPQQDGASALGVFQIPWQRITSSMENLAQSHETLAQKIEIDVEGPLRQFATKNREMQNMTTVQGNFAAIAKDVETAQRKVEKLRGSRAGADKVAGATSSVEDATLQWDSQAPPVYELLQSLDEMRLNHLRDVLTQFQTHEIDQVERNRLTAENCLNALLNIETADEIKTFAARVSGGRRSIPRRRSSAAGPAPIAASSPPLPPPPRIPDDRASQRSGVSGGPPRLPPVQEKETPKHSRFGMKRLGTVVGRRKSMAPPPPPGETPEKPKRSRASFAPFRRGDSSQSFQEVGSPPSTARDLTPVTSQDEASQFTSLESPMRRPPTNQSSVPADVDAIEPAPMHATTMPTTNGFFGNAPQRSPPPQQPSPPSQPLNEFKPLDRISQDSVGVSNPRTPTGPPLSVDAVRATTPSSSVNAENEDALRSLTIRDQPIQEDESAAKQAMNDMANQLRMQAQQSGLNRAQGSVRGRRDVRNTVYVPSPEPSDSSNVMSPATAASLAGAAGLASPIKELGPQSRAIGTPVPIPEDRAISDTTSIHSAHTLSGALAGPAHPELHEPGLSASIIETVSTWFSEGSVTKSSVVGELALAYNPTDSSSAANGFPPASESIRLDNFPVLEKVAANPSFVTATLSGKGKERAGPEDKAGEYSVALSAISRPTPTVGFKYQIHMDESDISIYSPILLIPAWQIQDDRASVIIVYTLNPAFKTSAPLTYLTLKNVTLTVALDPAAGKATNAMMSPTAGASFKRKQNLVVWRFPELVIDTEQKKFLARFMTNGPAKEGHVEAKWELTNEGGSGLGISISKSDAKESSDPFADDGSTASPTKSWEEAPCVRKLVAGRYSAT